MADHKIGIVVEGDAAGAVSSLNTAERAAEQLGNTKAGAKFATAMAAVNTAAEGTSSKVSSAMDKAKAKVEELNNASTSKLGAAMSSLSATAGGASASLGAAFDKAKSKVKSACAAMTSSVQNFANKVQSANKQISDAWDKLDLGGPGKVAAGVFAATGAAMGALGLKAINLAGNMQMTEMAFTTMLGSAEKAQSFIADMQNFAAKTPFEFTDVTDAAKRFLAFGFSAEQVIPTLRAVGDAAAGLGSGNEGMQRMIVALGQIKAKGKASAQEMMQLAENGVPAWQFLADAIGTDIPTAMDMVTKGAIDADITINAVTKGMTNRFGGMMDNMSKTVPGIWSNIQDAIGQSLTAIGKQLITAFNIDGWLSKVADALGNFTSVVQESGISEALKQCISPEVTAAAAVFAGILAGVLLAAVVALAPAIMALAAGAAAWVAASAPFIAAGAAIGAALWACWQYSDELSNAWEGLKATASTFVSAAVGLWNNLKAKFNEVVDAIIAKWNSLGDDLPTRIAGAIGLVIGFFATLPVKCGQYILELGLKAWDMRDEIVKAFMEVLAAAGNYFMQIPGKVAEMVIAAGQAGMALVDKAIEWGKGAYNAVKEWISKIPSMVSSFINGIKAGFSINLSSSSSGSSAAPGFASGGLVSKPTFAMVGEGGDREMIIPINSSSRSMGLWEQAGSMLGVSGGYSAGSSYSSGSSYSGSSAGGSSAGSSNTVAGLDKIGTKLAELQKKSAELQKGFNDFKIEGLKGSEKVYAEIEKERDTRITSLNDWVDKFKSSTQEAEAFRQQAAASGNTQELAAATALYEQRKAAEIAAMQEAANLRIQIDQQTNETLASNATQLQAIKAELEAASNEGNVAAYMQALSDQNVAFMADLQARQELMQTYYDWRMEAEQSYTSIMLDMANTLKQGLGSAFSDAIVYGKSFGSCIADLGKKIVAMFIQWQIERLAAAVLSKGLMQKETAQGIAQGTQLAAAYAPAAWAKLVLNPGAAAVATGLLTAGMTGSVGIGMAAAGAVGAIGASGGGSTPKLAAGGVVTAPTLAMVGEGGDDEAVIPLRKGIFSDLFGGETAQDGSGVTATQNIYGDINTGADSEELFSDFGDMLAAGIRGA